MFLPDYKTILLRIIRIIPAGELLILFVFILTINNYLGNPKSTIHSDGAGYYDYLPSLFERGDLNRKNITRGENAELYRRIDSLGTYVFYKDYMVNKYPCGTALLMAPFYAGARLFDGQDALRVNGIPAVMHRAIFYAALFYLFFALLFTRKLLRLYYVHPLYIWIVQWLLVFSTSVTIYVVQDASFSHIYSLAAMSAFLYITRKFILNPDKSLFLIACLLFGLIAILRPVNVVIISFLPFLAGSVADLRNGFLFLWKRPLLMLTGFAVASAILSLQMWFWYQQTGDFLLYSYQGERFNFLAPQIINVLFSYKKGLFIYTPVLLLSAAGLAVLAIEKRFFELTAWIAFFFILVYLLSSWWYWSYGSSYGHRAFIEFYPVFFVLVALAFEKTSAWVRTALLLLAFATIPLNLIQSWQYKNFYLHWFNMNRRDYWRIFLKQDAAYRGLLWKTRPDPTHARPVFSDEAGDICLRANSSKAFYQRPLAEIPGYHNLRYIEVSFIHRFPETERTTLDLHIYDKTTQSVHYYYNPSLLVHCEADFDVLHRGKFVYEINPLNPGHNYVLTLHAYTGKNFVLLKDLIIRYY